MIEFTVKLQTVGDAILIGTSSNITPRNIHMKTTGELMANGGHLP
jgi:hypothetical protein